MQVSDIAYLRKINAGLKAVSDANKSVVRESLLPFIEDLKEIKKNSDGVGFSGLSAMKNNQALRLASSNIIIYKDSNNMFIPLEIKTKNQIKVTDDMLKDEHFDSVVRYEAKTKEQLIKAIKEKISSSNEIKAALKAEGWSMTKIFNLPSMQEQNEILKNFGIYDMQNLLDNFDIKKEDVYRVTKEHFSDNWITDRLTKTIQKQYEDIKILLMSNPSASEIFAKTKKISSEIESILNNNPLNEIYTGEKDQTLFFSVSTKEVLHPKEKIDSLNFNPSFHMATISKSDAIKVVKANELEKKYGLQTKDDISLFLPASNIEQLKFGLIDYLTFQADMKNDYKMKMQATENSSFKRPTLTPGG